MKKTLWIFILLLMGCSTLAEKKSSYNEINTQQFVGLLRPFYPSTFPAPADAKIKKIVYAGSDDEYDYIWTFRAMTLVTPDYHEYKIKKGVLNLPKFFDFKPNPHFGDNYVIISNVSEEEANAELKILLK